jgi:hypothetical protein
LWSDVLTVIADPHKNVLMGDIPSGGTAGGVNIDMIAGSSPAKTIIGRSKMAL